jgi:hypothetical protein
MRYEEGCVDKHISYLISYMKDRVTAEKESKAPPAKLSRAP